MNELHNMGTVFGPVKLLDQTYEEIGSYSSPEAMVAELVDAEPNNDIVYFNRNTPLVGFDPRLVGGKTKITHDLWTMDWSFQFRQRFFSDDAGRSLAKKLADIFGWSLDDTFDRYLTATGIELGEKELHDLELASILKKNIKLIPDAIRIMDMFSVYQDPLYVLGFIFRIYTHPSMESRTALYPNKNPDKVNIFGQEYLLSDFTEHTATCIYMDGHNGGSWDNIEIPEMGDICIINNPLRYTVTMLPHGIQLSIPVFSCKKVSV